MVCGITYHVVCHWYPQASTCEHQAEIETRELETRLRSEAAIELEAALVASRDAAEQHLSAQAEAARRETASAIEFAVAAAEERERRGPGAKLCCSIQRAETCIIAPQSPILLSVFSQYYEVYL